MRTHLPLAEWDQKVGPYLTSIRLRSASIVRDVTSITDSVKAIPAMPPWDTEAEDIAKKARDELVSAVCLMNDAISKMATKPKDA